MNTGRVDSILEALQAEDLVLDEKLISIYEAWIQENPFDEGAGWGKVPWSQKEMPVTDEMLTCAADADAAVARP